MCGRRALCSEVLLPEVPLGARRAPLPGPAAAMTGRSGERERRSVLMSTVGLRERPSEIALRSLWGLGNNPL